MHHIDTVMLISIMFHLKIRNIRYKNIKIMLQLHKKNDNKKPVYLLDVRLLIMQFSNSSIIHDQLILISPATWFFTNQRFELFNIAAF